MDRAHLGSEALGLHQLDDAIDGMAGEGPHVLAEIDGDIGLAITLIRCERASGHHAYDAMPDVIQARPLHHTLRLAHREAPHELA